MTETVTTCGVRTYNLCTGVPHVYSRPMENISLTDIGYSNDDIVSVNGGRVAKLVTYKGIRAYNLRLKSTRGKNICGTSICTPCIVIWYPCDDVFTVTRYTYTRTKIIICSYIIGLNLRLLCPSGPRSDKNISGASISTPGVFPRRPYNGGVSIIRYRHRVTEIVTGFFIMRLDLCLL